MQLASPAIASGKAKTQELSPLPSPINSPVDLEPLPGLQIEPL